MLVVLIICVSLSAAVAASEIETSMFKKVNQWFLKSVGYMKPRTYVTQPIPSIPKKVEGTSKNVGYELQDGSSDTVCATNGVVACSSGVCCENADSSASGFCCGDNDSFSCCSTYMSNNVVVVSCCDDGFNCEGNGDCVRSGCFSGDETVQLEMGDRKKISDVHVGDRVLSFSTELNAMVFSDVVYVPHQRNNQAALFTEVITSAERIKVTPEHLLLAGACGSSSLPLVEAQTVKEGQCLLTVNGQMEVKTVRSVTGNGLYSIVTNEEYVVVGDVVASPFAKYHWFINKFYNLHRMVYYYMPSAMKSQLFHAVNNAAGMVESAYIESFFTSSVMSGL